MKKKIILGTILGIILIGGLTAGILYLYSRVSNPWNVNTIGEIPTPIGYTRVDAPAGSFGSFARSLPLEKRGSKVHLYTGGDARFQSLSTGVIAMPLLSNYEQCADVTMRLKAEYLFSQGRFSEIRFTDVNGKRQIYTGGNSRKAFEKYMRNIYGCCSTFSLFHETTPRKASEVQPGDVLVYPARPGRKYGHALIVIDVAHNESGNVAIMCAEGNTPARDIHVVRNNNPIRNPWFIIDDDDEVFWILPFHFKREELRHY